MEIPERANTVSPTSTPPVVTGESPPRVAGYTLHRRIGSGNYGDVWLAQSAVGEWRAVKLVRRDRFDDAEPVEREFRGISNYAPVSWLHPSLLRILHVERDDAAGRFSYVMELADDARDTPVVDPATYAPKTLRSVLRERGRLTLKECVSIGLDLATALRHLHERGLVHRDVKPSNIVFVRGEARLADIGLVANSERTVSLAGTEGYQPAEGFGRPAADLYALGKVLYEMSTGLDRLQYPKLPDLRRMPAVEGKAILELNRVILRACHTQPARRYAVTADLIADLNLLHEGSSLRLRRLLKLTCMGLAAAVAVLLAGFAAREVWRWSREQVRQRESFLREAEAWRRDVRRAGWPREVGQRLSAAGAIARDQELTNQMAATLSWPNAEVIAESTNTSGSAVAFAPDGRLLAGGERDTPAHILLTNGTLVELEVRGYGPVCFDARSQPLEFTPGEPGRFVLREADSGRARREFVLTGEPNISENRHPVLAMTTDGSRVAAAVGRGETNGLVTAWNALTGETLGHFECRATALAFSSDGSLLAVGDDAGQTIVLAVPGLQTNATLKPSGDQSRVRALAFTPDPLVPPEGVKPGVWLLAVGDHGGGIRLWDVTAEQVRQHFPGSQHGVSALAFHPDGSLLASGGRSFLLLWDVATGQPLLQLSSPRFSLDFAQGLAFSLDGRQLAAASLSNSVHPGSISVWNLELARGVRALRGLNGQTGRMWFSPDSRRVATVSFGWKLAVWEVADGKLLRLFDAPKGEYADNAAGAFPHDGKRFAFAAGREARLYDLSTGRRIDSWPLNRGLADDLMFDAQGDLLLLRREARRPGESRLGSWRLWKLQANQPPLLLHQQEVTNWNAYYTGFSPAGDFFFVASARNEEGKHSLHAYELRTGREIWSTNCGMHEVPVRLDPKGQFLIVAAINSKTETELRRPSDGAVVLRLRDTPSPAAVSPSGQWFAGANSAGEWTFFGREGARHGYALAPEWQVSFSAVFSPDGKYLAWGTTAGVVVLADLDTVQRSLNLFPRQTP